MTTEKRGGQRVLERLHTLESLQKLLDETPATEVRRRQVIQAAIDWLGRHPVQKIYFLDKE